MAARIEVDLTAFRSNVRLLAETVAPARTMVAVKGNAYGHGLLPISFAALESGADSLAVLEIPAAFELRKAGVGVPLLAWLHGINSDFAGAVDSAVDIGISAVWQLDAITSAHRRTRGKVHLKVDTGLNRNGAHPDDWPELVEAALHAERAGAVEIVAIWSHLADASAQDDSDALTRFEVAVKIAADLGCTPGLLHLAASSAGLRMPRARLGLVRFGIAAYGISPFDDVSARELGLRQVMSMRAPVVHVNRQLARVGVGSADGIQIPAIGEAMVAVKGNRYRIANLDVDSLDIIVGVGEVSVGDEVTIFGPGDDGEPTAEDWAHWGGTIGDEIVARASERLPRVFLET